MKILHHCSLGPRDWKLEDLKWYRKCMLISPKSPECYVSFRSEMAVKIEQHRQLKISRYTIHPFSEFRSWYEVYLIYLYGSLLLTKPMNSAFVSSDSPKSLGFEIYSGLTNILSWIDILLNCITGYEIEKNVLIELRLRFIVKHYVLHGPFFVCDVLSSIPYWNNDDFVYDIVAIWSLFKVVRLFSLLSCLKRTAEYFQVKSKGAQFLLCSMIVSFIIVHWMACLQFAVPRFVRRSFVDTKQNISWFFKDGLYYKHISTKYTLAFFKSTAYILGIRMSIYPSDVIEEYVLAMVTYFLGKILIGFLWVILAVTILNARAMDIKFAQIMNQVEEYMRQKQLPVALRDRITQYFKFKYQEKYFREELMNNMLSDNIKMKVNMHMCMTLIKNVSLFNQLSPKELSTIVEHLIPEIFLPLDTIVQSGSYADAMYFLSSGTVAVYTRSGKEVCHLQDGAYFGEVGLVVKGQVRVTTTVAIETSHVYRLTKRDFDRCLLTNQTVMEKLMLNAEARLKEYARIEEDYKKVLFEQEYQKIY